MILKLKYYGSSILREKCRSIEKITDEVKKLAKDLIDSVLKYDGAGLSAPQVGYTLRLFVIRYSNEVDDQGFPLLCPPKIYINPKISVLVDREEAQTEGCLSIPGITGEVNRPIKILVEAMDLEGKLFTEEATGWRARVIMHENDHLNGVLFIDRLSPRQKKKVKHSLKAVHKKFNSAS